MQISQGGGSKIGDGGSTAGEEHIDPGLGEGFSDPNGAF